MSAILQRLLAPSIILRLPLAGVGLLVLYLAVEALRPGTLAAPPFETAAEAIVGGNVPQALEMLAAGERIDAPGRIRAGVLHRYELEATPLEAAILSRRIEAVTLMLRSGADPSRSPRVPCLARLRMPEALPLLGLGEASPDAPVAGPEEADQQCAVKGIP